VLSIGKVGLDPKQQLYYEQKVAKGREDYYSGGGEAPGRWTGTAARALGLPGEVGGKQLKALMDGRHPGTGEQLAIRGARSTTAAFDLTFSAPKSVSVLFALGDRELSRALVRAHEEAVDAALAYMEQEACRVRRGHNGTRAEREAGLARGWERVRPERAGGFLAAAYRHRMSRAQDPQLHTHAVCANMARGADGRWTALDGTTIYEHAKAGGHLYQAHLRHAVRERVPWAEWGPVANGMAELRQVPGEVLWEFSQRRRRILEREAELEAAGVQVGHAGRERIAYDTREPQQELDEAGWREQIRVRAAEHGLGQAELDALARLEPAPAAEPIAEATVGERLFSPHGLTATQNSFRDRDVVAAVAERCRQGAPVSGLLSLAERTLERAEAVPVAAGLDRRFTTRELLAAEQRIVEQAEQGRHQGAGVLTAQHADLVLRGLKQPLSGEQEQVVRAIVSAGHRIDTVEALAGTGKTTSAGALRGLYEQAGYRVVGAAPTGRAVRELKERAHISQSLTLDGWAVKLAADPTALSFAKISESGVRRQPAVMILDEAGLAHTRLSAQVIERAMAAEVKVVAIGDSGQLSSVQAGGWLGALTRRLGSHELREVMRQRDPHERRLLAHVHRGDPAPYLKLKAIRRELHLYTGEQPDLDAEQAVIEGWAAASARHGADQAVIVCRENRRRARLNQLARAHLREHGQLGDGIQIASGQWAVGDRVIARRNDRGRDLDNGMRATVTAVDGDRHRLIVQVDSGGVRELDAGYVERHLQHAYALTGHGMQGGTVQWTGVVGQPEDFSRNWSYTALSRARDPVHVYLIDEPSSLRQDREEVAPAPEPGEQRDPLERLSRRMRERDNEDLALEQLEHARRAPDNRDASIEPAAGGTRPDAALARPTAAPEEESPRSQALARLEELDRELARLHTELGNPQIEDARAIASLGETITAVQAEQERDNKPRGLRDRAAYRTRSRERERRLESLRDRRAQLLDPAPDPDVVLAGAEQLRRRQQQLGCERRRLRDQAIEEEIAGRPPWLIDTLGREPGDPSGRERWRRTAREVAGHRIDHGIADPDVALDGDGHDQAIRRAIADARTELGLDDPGRDRDGGREI
jgi:conjugative relaxase-like TrwC/TraI family protein